MKRNTLIAIIISALTTYLPFWQWENTLQPITAFLAFWLLAFIFLVGTEHTERSGK